MIPLLAGNNHILKVSVNILSFQNNFFYQLAGLEACTPGTQLQ
jgi:hypothetical protein